MKQTKRISVMITMLLFMLVMLPMKKVEAATKYYTTEEYITKLVKELGIKINKKEDSPYMSAALREGLIKEKEFADPSKILTRTNSSILIVRADEYLHGVTISDERVNTIIEKRISDIEKIGKTKRVYVAKAYALGFIKGYSNGAYSTDREFRGSGKLTVTSGKAMLKMLKDKSLRAVVTNDGQLTRTTNLPYNANLYPYILASYPNDYYNWEFRYMKMFDDGKYFYQTGQFKRLVDYAAPVDMPEMTYYHWVKEGETFQDVIDKYGDLWAEKVRKYMETAFDVNYKTIKKDKEWQNTILSLDNDYGFVNINNTERYIQRYMDAVVKNKTIMEVDKVAVDKSTLYYYDGEFYLRTYIKYRIISAIEVNPDGFLSPMAFTKYIGSDYVNVTMGEWREGYYDVSMTGNGDGKRNPEDLGIYDLYNSDYFKLTYVMKK